MYVTMECVCKCLLIKVILGYLLVTFLLSRTLIVIVTYNAKKGSMTLGIVDREDLGEIIWENRFCSCPKYSARPRKPCTRS